MPRPLSLLLRLSTCRSWLQLAAVSCMIAMSGCSFGEQMPEAAEANTCQVDADCDTQRCVSGRCVSKSQEALNISLVITPTRMPDGSAAFPIVSAPFALRGGEQAFSFQLPVSLPVRIHDSRHDEGAGRDIAAYISFTPVAAQRRLNLMTAQLTTVVPSPEQPRPANNVMLLGDTEYNVLVQPVDTRLPPHSLRFTPEAGGRLDVDYADIDWQTRSYVVRNLSGEAYNVRARVKGGGAALSNTQQISGTTGRVTLTFDPVDTTAYELELAPAEQRYYTTRDEAGACGSAAPRPTLSVDASGLKTLLDAYVVDLPKLPDPVEYQAVVRSCTPDKLSGELPVTLTTSALIFESSGASSASTTLSPVTGRFEVDTSATWDPDLGTLGFCARVPPGDYTVVVTPMANLGCEIFAERRLLTPRAADSRDVEPDPLELRKPTTLSGHVYTPDRLPMGNATVNLVALHRASAMPLGEKDRSVVSYNRSRQVTTAADGSFSVPVDLGSYDVIVRPPAQSNYAWRVLYDIDVGARDIPFSTEVMLSAPVLITGKLRYAAGTDRDQSSLASAEVHAYTLVDEGLPSERSVEVARGQADASGNVMLLMPPQLQRSFIPE